MPDKPTLRRRELGRLLRQLREQAGLNAEEAGRHVDLSPSTMSRLERGTAPIRKLVINALLVLYNAPENTHVSVQTLAAQAQERGWWQDLGALPPGLGGYVGLEADAVALRTYDTHLIHGLLQIADYTRAQATAARPHASPAEIDRLVRVRTTRQARLTDSVRPLHLTALLEQGALERPIGGPAVMRTQLSALLEAMERPNVTLAVLPTAVGAHEGLDGPFSILSFSPYTDQDTGGTDQGCGEDGEDSDYPDVGHIDTRAGPLFVERAEDVDQLARLYDRLHQRALDPNSTEAAIKTALKETT